MISGDICGILEDAVRTSQYVSVCVKHLITGELMSSLSE